MPADILLKIEGIQGESKVLEGAIDVVAWSWGMTQPSKWLGAGEAGRGGFSIHDLTITKFLDRSSPALMTQCARQKSMSSAELLCHKAGGGPLEFLKIRLSPVVVTEVIPAGSAGDDRFLETIVLNFQAVHVTYVEQDEQGQQKGGTVEFEYSIPKGK